MNILVTARPGASTGTLALVDGKGSVRTLDICTLGPGGIVPEKREGDRSTPIGRFPLRRVLYRADRVAAPVTTLPVSAIAKDDGWCDAPKNLSYNRPIKLPYSASHEKLWREDHLYDLVLVLGHNDDPPVPFHGSCIFLHLMRAPDKPTGGCVGVTESDFRAIIKACNAGSFIEIAAE